MKFIKISQWILANLPIILILFFISVFISIYFYPGFLPDGKEIELVIGFLIFYFGLVMNLINYKIAYDQFFKALFTEFNNRFDSMNDALNAIRNGETVYKYGDNIKSTEAIILDYLNLCSEEYLWFTKGRIEHKTWLSWRKGMDFYLSHIEFKDIVEKCKKERESYYGLFDVLDITIEKL